MISTGAGTAVVSAFLASLVEFVEAATIVLAVSTTRGWRAALAGTVIATVMLALLVLLFGPALTRIPFQTLQLVIGVLLLMFGLRWLRKAVLRAAGLIALHDEDAIYAREQAGLAAAGTARPGIDRIGAIAAFKAVALEGLEVVFIVIATGVNGALVPASIGAAAAGVLVTAIALLLHHPLSRVPENTLKFSVGVLLSAFGGFWCGEGLGIEWPGGDLSLVALMGALLLVAILVVTTIRRTAPPVVAA